MYHVTGGPDVEIHSEAILILTCFAMQIEVNTTIH